MCDTHFEYQVDHKDVFGKEETPSYTEFGRPANITNLMTGSTPEMRENFPLGLLL